MPKLPHLSGRDIIKTLEKLGFSAEQQNRLAHSFTRLSTALIH